MLCFSHLPKLSHRCPHCRQHPLTLVCEYELQPQMDRLRFEARQHGRDSGRQFQCAIKSCEAEGTYTQMEAHQRKRHPELSIEWVLFGDEPREVYNPTRSEQGIAEYARMPRAPSLPPGQQRKVPTHTQAVTMARHAKTCKDGKCQAVWTGPWGSFIGGELGETHFDLTLCERGRRLN